MAERSEILEKLKALSSETPSDWRKQAEWRVKNREWLRVSGAIALKILMNHDGETSEQIHQFVREKLDCDESAVSRIMRGDADLHLSAIIALIGFDGLCDAVNGLKNYMNNAARNGK